MSKQNYKAGLERFVNNEYSPELLLSVSMNRKSANYDKPYVALYEDLYKVYMEQDYSKVEALLVDLSSFQSSISKSGKNLIQISHESYNKKQGEAVLKALPVGVLDSEESFRRFSI